MTADCFSNPIKSITYLAFFGTAVAPGVENKVMHTVNALTAKSYRASADIVLTPSVEGLWKLLRATIRCRTDLLILRFPGRMKMVVLSPVILWHRLCSRKTIIDVPTPLVNQIHEIKGSCSAVGAFSRIALLCAAYPWALWPAHRILQYGKEHPWFLVGLKSKTLLVANGIDVAAIQPRHRTPPWPASTLTLIGVAKVDFWHGYDRIIRGLADYHAARAASPTLPDVRLLIVGDGGERLRLEDISRRLGTTDAVEFMGWMTGKDLDALYEKAHVAVGSLGLHRIALPIASILKAREYTCKGIPFIAAAEDPDFPDSVPFVLKVAADDSPLDIRQVIAWYSGLADAGILNGTMREYAESKLDYSKKISAFEFKDRS